MNKFIWIGLSGLLICQWPAVAAPPRNLRVVPSVPGSAVSVLKSGPEQEALIEAIEKIHGLNADEAVAVLFARAAWTHKEASLPEELLRDWAELLQVRVSEDEPESAALMADHDLDAVEAQLVLLARRTSERAGMDVSAKALLSRYFAELIKRVDEDGRRG